MYMAYYYINKNWPLISVIIPLILPHLPASIKLHLNIIFPSFISTAQQSLVGRDLFIIEASLSHSDPPHSVRILWKSDQPHIQTTHNTHNRQISMLPAEFEPKIPANEWPQNPPSDQATTRIGHLPIYFQMFQEVSIFHLLLPAISTLLCPSVLYVQPILPQQNIVKQE